MKSIWIVTAEVGVNPGDLPSGAIYAFTNVTTWADSKEEARNKIDQMLRSYGWNLISIEDAHPLDQDRQYSQAVLENIERARDNPKAVLLGRFFSFK